MVSSTLCRLALIGISFALIAFSTFASLFGILSTQWFTGTVKILWTTYRVNIGLGSCGSTSTGDIQYCDSFNWSNLSGTAEKAMAVMLIIATLLGFVAMIVLALGFARGMFICCKVTGTNMIVFVLATLQSFFLAVVCITMSGLYDWSPPKYTEMGPAFVCAIIGCVAAFAGGLISLLSQRIKAIESS